MKWLSKFLRQSGAATRMDFSITIAHDDVTNVWYVHESAIPGLHAEAATLDELVEVITELAPDLVEANCPKPEVKRALSIPLRIEHFVSAKFAPC